MTAVYLAAFIVGGIAVLSALLLADIGHGDGMPFLSLTGLSAGLLGAGTGGLVATWAGVGGVAAGAIAGGSAVALMFALNGLLLPYIRRQQANSHRGRVSYIGLLGTVTLDVPVGGWGEVSFVDADGNRVRSRAKSNEPDAAQVHPDLHRRRRRRLRSCRRGPRALITFEKGQQPCPPCSSS